MNKLTFRNKLLLILIAPLIGLLYFSVREVIEKREISSDMTQNSRVIGMCSKMSNLIHCIQKERGATAIFLGSQGNKFNKELQLFRQNTNKSLNDLELYLTDLDEKRMELAILEKLDATKQKLHLLDKKRMSIDAMDMKLNQALNYYTSMNSCMIEIVNLVTINSDVAAVIKTTGAYYYFLQSKERAGIERAIFSNAFTRDTLTNAQLEKAIRLVSTQDLFAEQFIRLATDSLEQSYKEILKATCVKETAAMRSTLFEKGTLGSFGIDPANWFQKQTEKINLLKQLEDQISAELLSLCNHMEAQSNMEWILTLTIAFVVFIVAMTLGYYFSKNILQDIGGEPRDVMALTARISKGELNMVIDTNENATGIYAELLKMTAKLKSLISVVTNSSVHVAAASNELSTTAMQMSQGASEQASSAEEVSAAMEEMVATILQNMENALKTEAITQTAAAEIVESNSAVNETVNSMQMINDRISMIGEIVHQTNLLALNASVEAARAGEHGAGFSVVANEVKKLAERSRNAATEINDVSSSCVEQAEISGRLLNELTPRIREAFEMLKEISLTSKEQNNGADQVNIAMQELNKIVQQNAAAAEELASNSTELSHHADKLKSTVAYFKVA